jgi:DNA-directed RNA polymerase subunit M/transcription elongation factor TFIIS
MRFCPVCAYYLSLKVRTSEEDRGVDLLCRHCGYKEEMKPKSSEEALILEMNFAAAGSQKQTVSQLNEFTKLDPTLPRLKTIACPNQACPTQADPATRDILYIKTDAKNLKYQYACTACSTQWGS